MRLQPKADAANVRLVAGDLPSVTVPCDARLVEHAVANLVENALRYSGSPDIALSIAVRDGKAAGKSADIVVTATGAASPVLDFEDLGPGALYINFGGYECTYDCFLAVDGADTG